MNKVILIWLYERGIEVFGTALLLTIYEPAGGFNSEGSIFDAFLFHLLFPLYFYILAAYAISCVLFGLIFRHANPFVQSIIFCGAFLFHCGIMFFMSPHLEWVEWMPAIISGVIAVAVSSFSGSRLLAQWRK